MAIFFVLLAGLFATTANFCMRKSIDAGGSTRAYLLVQMTFSFFVMIALNPFRTGNFAWSWPTVYLGLIGGILFGLLMWGIGKALENGPPGLSFAFLNTASVIPAILMVLLFGPVYGHAYTLYNGIGSVLVVIGLFWAGWSLEENSNKARWFFFVIFILVMHALFLVYLQWWALLLKKGELPVSPLLTVAVDTMKLEWFMPAVLFVGALFQWVVYLTKESRIPNKAEMGYGFMGGITNGACTFFLILAPQVANIWENAMIFPIFSVSIILLCNVWAQLLYRERVNWWANGVCVLGLIVGTVAWNTFFVLEPVQNLSDSLYSFHFNQFFE
ncbi:MAG: hypothetical protein KDK55_00955 [Chlamydiia bacterium]|nr:hypothetical protein [Chlamydiia bacterium]